MRVSFASATHEELRQGMERLGATLRAAASEAAASAAAAGAARAARPARQQASAPAGAAHSAAQQNGDAHLATTQEPSSNKYTELHSAGNGHLRAAEAGGGQSIGVDSILQGAGPPSAELGKLGKGIQGLSVSQDAGKGPGAVSPMPDGAAWAELASGSPEVTADALASQPAKTMEA